MEVLWYLTGPDGRYPWRADGARKLSYPYFQQLARAVDHLGFTGALLATGSHDAWVEGASLIPLSAKYAENPLYFNSIWWPLFTGPYLGPYPAFDGRVGVRAARRHDLEFGRPAAPRP